MIDPVELVNRIKGIGYRVNDVDMRNYRLRDWYSFHAHSDERVFLVSYQYGRYSSTEITNKHAVRDFYIGPSADELVETMSALIGD